jgi:hypothetical protein
VEIPHDCGQTCPQLESLEVRNVLLEVLVDLLLVLLEGRELGDVVLGYYTVHLGLAELDDALAQVAQVLEQVVVVGIDELPIENWSVDVKQAKWSLYYLLPLEFRVACLWPPRQEVVPPDIGIDAGITSIVTEDANTLRFAELAALVVEVLGCGQVLDLCPVLPCAELGGGEDDGVETLAS